MTSAGLFPPPPASLTAGLAALEAALTEVQPLRPKHREALPAGIRTLSAYLTSERDRRPRDYMSRPPLLAAYLNYFLPWNVYRQGRLLAGLDFQVRPGARIVDLGAGPLTFALALALARPALGERPLSYLAIDRADPPLRLGRRLLDALAAPAAWDVRTARQAAGTGRAPRADLLVVANLLNELDWAADGGGRRGDPEAGTPHDRMVARWDGQVATEGAVLLVEPGTRTAARNLVRLREAALARGWRVLAPCPHGATCPMPGQRNRSWCHFNFTPDGAPAWLVRLGNRVRLPKDRASLSFLLLVRGDDPPVRVRAGQGPDLVRVVSEPFDLPDWRRGRYGCAERGLVLLEDRPGGQGPQPGDLRQVRWPDAPRRDPKSGALVVPRRG